MLIAIISQQLNCFSLESQIIYHSQSSSVQFLGVSDINLPQEELDICTSQLVGKNYIAYIYVGEIIFQSEQLTFSAESTIDISLDCQTANKCNYTDIYQFSIASFEFAFTDINIQLSGAAGQLRYRIFDHSDCYSEAKVTQDLKPGFEKLNLVLKPRQRCQTAPDDATLMRGIIQNGETIMNETVAISGTWSDYVHNTLTWDITCTDATCSQKVADLINKDTQPISYFYQTKLTVVKTDNTQTYLETIIIPVTSIQPIQGDDCHSLVTGEFFVDRIIVTLYPGVCAVCRRENYATLVDFDYINQTILVSELEDFSGFILRESSKVYSIDGRAQQTLTLQCSDYNSDHCAADLQKITTLPSNITGQIIYEFIKGTTVVHKTAYPLQILVAEFQKCKVVLKEAEVCLSLDKAMGVSQRVQITIESQVTEFDVQLDSGEICVAIDQTKIHTKQLAKQQNIDIKVVIGQKQIPNVDLRIICSGQVMWQAWVAFGASIVLAIGLAVGISVWG
ncbi:Conserved_hypothetical protein [Hexamita inflata]|uniref:Transmembrane protein n=1 Tax=Hexamita inflata TaxID=28002 RepID=A0AA86QSG2_9EUKA|nr:Conserved hypothetical protein [Hexamita inflata]